MGLSPVVVGALITAATTVGATAIHSEAEKKRASHASKKARSEAAKKKREIQLGTPKSTGQRLLGGRSTLG